MSMIHWSPVYLRKKISLVPGKCHRQFLVVFIKLTQLTQNNNQLIKGIGHDMRKMDGNICCIAHRKADWSLVR